MSVTMRDILPCLADTAKIDAGVRNAWRLDWLQVEVEVEDPGAKPKASSSDSSEGRKREGKKLRLQIGSCFEKLSSPGMVSKDAFLAFCRSCFGTNGEGGGGRGVEVVTF